jgi:hypothetical protein
MKYSFDTNDRPFKAILAGTKKKGLKKNGIYAIELDLLK